MKKEEAEEKKRLAEEARAANIIPDALSNLKLETTPLTSGSVPTANA